MNIVLTGLPKSPRVKIQHLIFLFKPLLRKVNADKFWITEIYDIVGTDTKGAKIELQTAEEANSAVKVLDGFIYREGLGRYPLKAFIDGTVPYGASNYGHRGPPGHSDRSRYTERDRYNRGDRRAHVSSERNRSRSPHLRNEASRLDLEIELLRKKRMIIEEERRLLLEKKKLEKVKELASSAVIDTELMEACGPDTRHRGAREGPVHQPQPPHNQPKGSTYKADKPRNKDRLPAFHTPCNMILGDMKAILKQNAPPGEISLLYRLLRTALRKRFTLALANERKKLDSKQIVIIYRELYPKTTDELIVKQILDDIKACHLSDESTGGNIKSPKTGKDTNVHVGEGEGSTAMVEQENASAVMEVTTEANESMGQEENTTAEVNENVETDTFVGAADITSEPATKKEAEVVTQGTGNAPENVAELKADVVDMHKNGEHELSKNSTEVDMAAENNWTEGDDWNDLETEGSDEMLE